MARAGGTSSKQALLHSYYLLDACSYEACPALKLGPAHGGRLVLAASGPRYSSSRCRPTPPQQRKAPAASPKGRDPSQRPTSPRAPESSTACLSVRQRPPSRVALSHRWSDCHTRYTLSASAAFPSLLLPKPLWHADLSPPPPPSAETFDKRPSPPRNPRGGQHPVGLASNPL
ncbi:hypothetical protein CDD83_1905 [Cordyceps sp. RAO-2017]|nr:hypothetical protein CDD83_1905 [Cordyceps sp. RAO-2017]